VVAANGAVVHHNVPRPKSDGVPLCTLALLPTRIGAEPTFLTSKRFLSPSELAPALDALALGAGASVMFTSAMSAVDVVGLMRGRGGDAQHGVRGAGGVFGDRSVDGEDYIA
jgi:hypothetical protein